MWHEASHFEETQWPARGPPLCSCHLAHPRSCAPQKMLVSCVAGQNVERQESPFWSGASGRGGRWFLSRDVLKSCEAHQRVWAGFVLTLSSSVSMKPLWSVSYFRQVCGGCGRKRHALGAPAGKARVRDAAAAGRLRPRARYLHELLAGPELLAAEEQHEVLLRGQHVRQLQRGGGCQGRGPGASPAPAPRPGSGRALGTRRAGVGRGLPGRGPGSPETRLLGGRPLLRAPGPLSEPTTDGRPRVPVGGRTQAARAVGRASASPGPREAPSAQQKATRSNLGPVAAGGDRPRGGGHCGVAGSRAPEAARLPGVPADAAWAAVCAAVSST